jgi:hypothetical protein
LLELRELIGERASDAERALLYRQRRNPERAASRRQDCAVCGAALIGCCVDAATCSAIVVKP